MPKDAEYVLQRTSGYLYFNSSFIKKVTKVLFLVPFLFSLLNCFLFLFLIMARSFFRVHGFYGASSMERLPVETAITSQMKLFKNITFTPYKNLTLTVGHQDAKQKNGKSKGKSNNSPHSAAGRSGQSSPSSQGSSSKQRYQKNKNKDKNKNKEKSQKTNPAVNSPQGIRVKGAYYRG